MLAKFGHNELNNFEKTSSTTEEAIVNKLRDSVKLIYEENEKLHSDHDILKNELSIVTKNLNDSQKKVLELTKIIENYELNLHDNQIGLNKTDEIQESNNFNFEEIDDLKLKNNLYDTSEKYYSISSASQSSYHDQYESLIADSPIDLKTRSKFIIYN